MLFLCVINGETTELMNDSEVPDKLGGQSWSSSLVLWFNRKSIYVLWSGNDANTGRYHLCAWKLRKNLPRVALPAVGDHPTAVLCSCTWFQSTGIAVKRVFIFYIILYVDIKNNINKSISVSIFLSRDKEWIDLESIQFDSR